VLYSVLQCVQVSCSVLQRVHILYVAPRVGGMHAADQMPISVLQCVAVYCCALSVYFLCTLHLVSVACTLLIRGTSVCCSVLQCVAVCCSVLQCVVVCCSVLQCAAVWCGVLRCVAPRVGGVHAADRRHISVLQRVAVCCSV